MLENLSTESNDPKGANPPPNPLDGKVGFTHELLESLTDEELTEYETYLRWIESNSTYDETNVYRSKSYAFYRRSRWHSMIYEIREERQKTSNASNASNEICGCGQTSL